MKYLIVILTMTLVGCVSTKELEKRDAKIERLELALEVRTAWSYFWYQAFEACAQNNYAEPKAEEDYQVEVELKTDVEPSDKIKECIQSTYDQVDLYGDLCAESSSGYEDMTGSEAHFEGVKCASETIRWCLED